MKYQKSPLPYLILLVAIISIAVYSTVTIDKQINQPMVYSIKKDAENKHLLAIDEVENSISKTPYTTFISK